MAVAECTRLVLYLLEWIWTTVILAIFPAQLIARDVTLTDGGTGSVCKFTQTLGISRCNFGVSSAYTVQPLLLLPRVVHGFDC